MDGCRKRTVRSNFFLYRNTCSSTGTTSRRDRNRDRADIRTSFLRTGLQSVLPVS